MAEFGNRRLKSLRGALLTLIWLLGIASTIATGGGGGDDDGSGPVIQAPTLTGASLEVDSLDYLEGDDEVEVTYTLTYADPDRDIVRILITGPDASTLDVTVPSPQPDTSGELTGVVVFATTTAGAFTVTFQLLDAAGNRSNVQSTSLTVRGSAELSDLSLSSGVLDPLFSAAETAYQVSVGHDVDAVTVTATLVENAASLQIDGLDAASGSPSAPLDLAVGDNEITVVVNSSDDLEAATYTITVQRLASALLSDLTSSAGPFDQVFDPTSFAYTDTVDALRSEVILAPGTEDPDATATVNGGAVLHGDSSPPLVLEPGENPIEVRVTASDGETESTYALDMTRLGVDSLAQRAYVKASNPDPDDRFAGGFLGLGGTLLADSVALSGDTLAIGATLEGSAATGIDSDQSDNSALVAGSVYVFQRDAGDAWSQQAYLKASNTDGGDGFGFAVAADVDLLAIGAPFEDSASLGINGDQDNNDAADAGAVYVFARDESGAWSQEAYLKASNAATGNEFGSRVALSDGFLAVSSASEVYVFERSGGGLWSEQSLLRSSNWDVADGFGSDIAIDGITLAVGAEWEGSAATGIDGDQADNSAANAGAVYVFVRDQSGVWIQAAYIKASNTDQGDNFGVSVSLAGNTLAVGADREDSGATGIDGDQGNQGLSFNSGAAYVFTRDVAGVWSQQAYIKASNTDIENYFGTAVALSGNTLAVGAPLETSGATGVNGDQTQIPNGWPGRGAVYVFNRDGTDAWSQIAYVKPSNVDTWLGFGGALALDGDTLVVGADGDDSASPGIDGDQDDTSAGGSGAAYVFR